MKWFVLLVVFFGISQAAPVEYLAKIDLAAQGRIYDLGDMRINVIDELEGYCLAVITDDEFALLRMRNFPYQVLDVNPREKSYYIVYPATWVPLDNLTPYGDILLYDGHVVIFRMEEKNVYFLNQMQVELKKVFFEPMVLERDTKSLLPPASPLVDTLIQQMVNQVSPDTLLSFLNILTKNFGNRYSTAPGCTLAVRWYYNKVRGYGVDSAYLHQWQTGYAKNGVGIKRGNRYTGWKRYYVICGHIDAVSVSPGADDNASGTACVLEAARILRRYRFENGIRYIAFTGEEQGLLGSAAYCSNARTQGDTVLGACNYDMIMFRFCNPETLRLAIGRTRADTVLYNAYKAAVDTYTTQRTLRQGLSGGSSDNASFWNNGYPAFCGIENRYGQNPHYHTSHDSVGASGYDIPFLTSCVKAAVAGLARLAVPMALGIEEGVSAGNPAEFRITVQPNPFRKSTVITGAVPVAGTTQLRVFDVSGRCVRMVSQEHSGSGLQRFVWNRIDDAGRRLPAGVYIVSLEIGTARVSTKVVVVD